MTWRGEAFSGAKLVLLIGDHLLTILRDDRPDIPWPDHWDLPGGGREDAEDPIACVLRETQEEVGLCLSASDLLWRGRFEGQGQHAPSWWFAARLPPAAQKGIRFGDEGQRWALVAPSLWLADPKVVPHFKPRLRRALSALSLG